MKNLTPYLTIPYIKNRAKFTNLKSVIVPAINDVLESSSGSVSQDDPENQYVSNEDNSDRGIKCHVCIKHLQGMKDEERRRRKGNLNSMKKKRKDAPICPKHRSKKVDGGFHCNVCDQ